MRKINTWLFLIISVLFILFPPKTFAANWTQTNVTTGNGLVIRVSPSDHDTVFAAIIGNSLGKVFRSLDGGLTWTPIDNGINFGSDISSLVVDATSSSHLYVGVYANGIYMTTNQGGSWVYRGLSNLRIRSMAIDPSNASIVYVGAGDSNSNGGVYKTTNAGESWVLLSNGISQENIMYISVSKKDPRLVIAGSGDHLWKSEDSGEHWVVVPDFTGPGKGINGAILINPINDNKIFVAMGYAKGIWYSSDRGSHWSKISQDIEAYELAFNPNNLDEIYATSRGPAPYGVYLYSNGSSPWVDISDNLPSKYTIGMDITLSRLILFSNSFGIWVRDLSSISRSHSPVVLIPGLGASWSYKGLIENGTTSYADWKLLPVFTEDYQAFLTTLKNAGLVDGQNLFTFAYDWRQPMVNSGVWLNNYLTNVVLAGKPIGTKVDLVGHSLDGLVARACIEKVAGCKDKIGKFISVGSPHLGAVDAYYLWEGGEILETNLMKRLAENVLLRVNAKSFASSKDIIQNIAPSIRDILPVFDYISGKSYISMSDSAKNKFLGSAGTGQTKDVATTVYGNVIATSRWLTTTTPTAAETKLGLWKDGKPTGSTSDIGDGTVLASSAQISGSPNYPFNFDHLGLISGSLPQQKILDILGLSGTVVSPASPPTKGLLFFIQSPANLTVSGAGTQIDAKTVAISDPTDQDYQLTVTGTGIGSYALQIGSFTSSTQSWQEVSGKTTVGKTDNFTVNFTKILDLDGLINLNAARTKIVNLTNFSSQRDLLLRTDRVIAYVNQQNYIMARRELETLYETVFSQIAKAANTTTRQSLLLTGENFINAYEIIVAKGNINISPALAQTEISRGQKLIVKTIITSTVLAAQNLLEANKKLEQANSAYTQGLYPRALLLGRSIQFCLK